MITSKFSGTPSMFPAALHVAVEPKTARYFAVIRAVVLHGSQLAAKALAAMANPRVIGIDLGTTNRYAGNVATLLVPIGPRIWRDSMSSPPFMLVALLMLLTSF